MPVKVNFGIVLADAVTRNSALIEREIPCGILASFWVDAAFGCCSLRFNVPSYRDRRITWFAD